MFSWATLTELALPCPPGFPLPPSGFSLHTVTTGTFFYLNLAFFFSLPHENTSSTSTGFTPCVSAPQIFTA